MQGLIRHRFRIALAPIILTSEHAHDEGAQRELKKFTERRLKKGSIGDDRDRGAAGQGSPDVGFWQNSLSASIREPLLISTLTRARIADSLQSRDQLLKVAAHFALTRDEVQLTR
jgi:hypothetical protein